MLKQFATRFIVLCVSVLMLTLAVVPHHHHHGLPCFSIENEFDHNLPCNHHNDCDNAPQAYCGHHQHESNPEDENTCILDRLEFIAAFDQKTTHICPVCLHSHHHYLLQAILITFDYNVSVPEEITDFRQAPYSINYHSVFANQSLGLRAPPLS